MLWKIKKRLGKDHCIFYAVLMLVGAITVFFASGLVPELIVLDIIVSSITFIFSIVLFIAAFEEPPEEPAPFYHSLDDEGNHIMTNGTQTLYVDGRGNVSSEKPEPSVGTSSVSSKETKTEPEINYRLEERIIQREMEIERSRPELTPEKRLLALKTLFNDEEMTLEEYKIKKDTVIVIHLDDFLTEIDWQETDSEVALRRKLRYVESLYHDNLIDTEEFESIKSEIMENMDEEE